MADTAKKTAAPKAKRNTLTPAQRIAKMEAELEAAKVKATQQNSKKAAKLNDQRKALLKQIEDRKVKVTALEKQIDALVGDNQPELTAPSV